jgi:hypothetical protein
VDIYRSFALAERDLHASWARFNSIRFYVVDLRCTCSSLDPVWEDAVFKLAHELGGLLSKTEGENLQ